MSWLPFLRRSYLPGAGGEELPRRYQSDPLIGYRTWKVWQGLGGLTLASIHVAYDWQPGVNQAVCHTSARGRVPHSDPAPSLLCRCGIYAQTPEMPFSDWDHMVKGLVRAYGEISMTGRVVKCTNGWKAQKAEILSPVILDAACRYLENDVWCSDGVTRICLPTNGRIEFPGVCTRHFELVEEPSLEAGIWMAEAIRALSARYPGVQFDSFIS